MPYTTTKLRSIKSYPTYQLHAESLNDKTPAEDIFRICILETFHWLRSRLEGQEHIPNQFMLPSPDEYKKLDLDSLYSFSVEEGFTVDVVNVSKSRIWTFNITEPDMGANAGKPNERKPVHGRTFSTDIAFIMKERSVEMGIRTICSEPSESSEPCEVFRPALVKKLAANPLVGLREFYPIDGKAVIINTRAACDTLISYTEKYRDSLPLVIVCTAGCETAESDSGTKRSNLTAPSELIRNIDISESFSAVHVGSFLSDARVELDSERLKLDVRNGKNLLKEEKKRTVIKAEAVQKQENAHKTVMLENISYDKLASSALGFAHIFFVEDSCIKAVAQKTDTALKNGDIIIVCGNEVTHRYSYDLYRNRPDDFRHELYNIISELPKRRCFEYGDIIFHTDARLREIEEKQSESLSAEGRAALLSAENESLKQKINELQQLDADRTINSDEYRKVLKALKNYEAENERLSQAAESIRNEMEALTSSYRMSSSVIDFYRMKSERAAHFPVDKDSVCSWIEENFSDGIMLSSGVRTELKKYQGNLDTAILCDGILFLYGYALYRKGHIDAQLLELYAEQGSWEVQGCGAEALRIFHDDYSAVCCGEKHLMNLHIKYGINPQMLIRIYFCWDETSRKIIIGHMPEHLPTVRNGT